MYDMTPDLARIQQVIDSGPYRDTWASLSEYTLPQWYPKAKFGIFIHWGVYSVPAFGNEWYSRNMYDPARREFDHHRKTYGEHKDFGYKDFIPMFRAEKFDPNAWAQLFREAGARYVVPVAEHHDGFQMYKSDISHFNAYEMGPKRDVLGELKQACREAGLEVGASSHRAEHWFFMSAGKKFDSDIHEPLQRGDFYWPSMPEGDHFDLFSRPAPSEEFLQDWLVRTCEIIDRYEPRILYFDWWIQHSAFKPWLRKLAAYYYNRAERFGGGVICYKHDAFLFGTALPDVERGAFAQVQPYHWQTDTAIALNSWCYTEGNEYRAPQEIVQDLVDVVSKNGCMMLNVGPKADGTISEEETAVLRAIGKWLSVNGEAIYDSRVYRRYGEGPTRIQEGQFSDGVKKNYTSRDFRFTVAKGCIYAIAMRCSGDGHYCIETLGRRDASKTANFSGIIDDVAVLGWEGKPSWHREEAGLFIETGFRSDYPVVFRIRLK